MLNLNTMKQHTVIRRNGGEMFIFSFHGTATTSLRSFVAWCDSLLNPAIESLHDGEGSHSWIQNRQYTQVKTIERN